MISSLYGPIVSLRPDQAVIDVGGVGLSVTITPVTSSKLNVGNDVQFFTALVVREDSLTLFGFLDVTSRTLFELVQTVTGIGPRVAMSILGVLSPEDLASAISEENISAIERVPGIGRKGAQRLILELKGKLNEISLSRATPIHQPLWREQLSSALVGLGFSAKEADGAIGQLVISLRAENVDPKDFDLGELLKRALQSGHISS
jgi:Holliday junction DNA helicase RuvA